MPLQLTVCTNMLKKYQTSGLAMIGITGLECSYMYIIIDGMIALRDNYSMIAT